MVAQVVTFEENAGQIRDQLGRPRPDVIYSGTSEGLYFHVRRDGISYQLVRVEHLRAETKHPVTGVLNEPAVPDSFTIHRIDVDWLGQDPGYAIAEGEALPDPTHYYNVPDGMAPALNVRRYTEVKLKGLWPGVDLQFHARRGVLESDWGLARASDHTKIRFRITGAELTVAEDGGLVMHTPLGDVREAAPLAVQQGRHIPARWAVDGNTVRIELTGYAPTIPLVIDPMTRLWGTYYGGYNNDYPWDESVMANGNVITTGWTWSLNSIATSGAHQTTHGGGISDGFLFCFSPSGARLWSTYYGGEDDDQSTACSASAAGEIFIAGWSDSQTNIATPGTYGPTACLLGGRNAYLAKFNSNGVRQWGTYYCSDLESYILSSAADNAGGVYVCGWTDADTGYASVGCLQPAPLTFTYGVNGFMARFNASGQRVWGTFLDAVGENRATGCAVAPDGSVYVTGYERGGAPFLGTPGTYQTDTVGLYDAYLVKLSPLGGLIWSSYFGGPSADFAHDCAVAYNGNVTFVGMTSSDTSIASVGAHQESWGGLLDGFVATFDSQGQRLWSTYIGGPQNEVCYNVGLDDGGGINVVGQTESAVNLTTSNGFDISYAGQADAFAARFTPTGTCHWSTYYGGPSLDYGRGIASRNGDEVYFGGVTGSNSDIASPGSFDEFYNGGVTDGFLVKFDACDAFPISVAPTSTIICRGDSAVLTVSGGITQLWSPSQSLNTAVGDTVFASPLVTTNYLVKAFDSLYCGVTATVFVSVTVVDTSLTLTDTTLIADQANAQYQWVDCGNGGTLISGATDRILQPTSGGAYAVIVTYNGCTDTSACTAFSLTSMEDMAARADLRLFPNPVSDVLSFTCPNCRERNFLLLDPLGRVVRRVSVADPRNGSFEVGDLPSGIYFFGPVGGSRWVRVVKTRS